jgi:2'-5' RNA ligase
MVRCFIAIMIPNELRPRILDVQRKLRALPMRCKLVEPQNLHITLSFLGERSEAEVDSIKSKLDEVCGSHKCFEVHVNGLRLIPSERYVRVLALEVKSKVLFALASDIQRSFKGKFAPPHLTLGRVKQLLEREKALSGLLALADLSVGSFEVRSIQLVKSKLLPTGPVYEVVHQSLLS